MREEAAAKKKSYEKLKQREKSRKKREENLRKAALLSSVQVTNQPELMEAYHRLNSAIVESGTVASVEALIWFLEFIQIKKSPHALFFNGRQFQEFSSVKAAENAESRRQRRINELKRVL